MKIIQRNDTATNWTDKNPILLEGEIGIELPNKFKVGNGVATWTQLPYSDKDLTTEVNRLQSKINAEPDKVFTYRGKTLPTFPTEPMLGYYLTFYTLPTDNLVLQFPDVDIPVGTIMSIDNNDKNDDITYKPRLGDKIDNKLNLEVVLPPNSVAFLVKKDTGWHTAYSGIVADNLAKLMALIKPLLPQDSGLTIDEIQAQLKDRLHTFAEIQTEFAGQLHTLSDLEANGFEKDTYLYGFVDDVSVPTDTSWMISQARIYEPTSIPAQNKGRKHLALAVPIMQEPLIKELDVNDIDAGFKSHYYAVGNVPRKILITEETFDTSAVIKTQFVIGVESADASITGIQIDDGISNVANVKKINIKGAKISKIPNQDGMGASEIETTAGLNIHMLPPNEQYGNALCTELVVEQPLQVDDTPTGENTAKIYIEHDYFEKINAPGYLAYLAEDAEVVGKMRDILKHHKGVIWFDDIIVPNDGFFQIDRNNKAIGIQDWTEDDPNVTGGVNYLIALRIAMKGNAPDAGTVKIGCVKKGLTPLDTGVGYLEDVNGEPLVVERVYKSDEELGVLEIVAVVNAKGLQEFQTVVVDDFDNDVVILEDRTEGASGLMIQCIKSSKTGQGKTGNALQQFEIDTNQNIEFSSHYLGIDRFTIHYLAQRDEAIVSYTAGTNFSSIDGTNAQNKNGMKIGVANKNIVIEDDGVHLIDFTFGKVFSAEETRMLRNKKISFSTTHTNQGNAFRVGLAYWEGVPDAYTDEIIQSWSNVSPIAAANWQITQDFEIVENALAVDTVTTHEFTVPNEAVNYAIIAYPNAGPILPFKLELKEFIVSVKDPFTGYIVHAPELGNETHLIYDTEYKELRQDNQGYASLRYTINVAEQASPIGILGKGLADISLDTRFNKITGSAAKGGEGAIVFNTAGTATIHTNLRLWSEKAAGTKSNINFWWAKVLGSEGSETYDEIADSESEFEVLGGAKDVLYRSTTFNVDVEAGDILALRMQGDSADSAFLESTSPSKPMIQNMITFKELVSSDQGDTPGTGVDLSGFTLAPQIVEYGIYQFIQKSEVSIDIDIPADVQASVIAVEEQSLTTGVIRPMTNVDYQYDPNTKKWNFTLGAIKTGQIIIAFYA